MGKPINAGIRHLIIEGRHSGKTLSELSALHGVSYTSVQQLCHRYNEEGKTGLKPRYSSCGRKRPDASSHFIYRAMLCYKCWHPTWGAGKIKAEILLLRPELSLPPLRTIQKWFCYAGLDKLRNRLPRQAKQWAKSAHEVWQIDAKEEMQIRDGTKNCWLNIKDEYTGAVLSPVVFPL